MGAIAIPLGKLIADGLIALAVVIGIVALSVIAKEIAEYIARELSDAIARARECRNCNCPECVPPKGTVGYRIDWVPPSIPHHPCPSHHVHFYIRSQNPNNCMCFWAPQRRNVLCLDENLTPDDFDPGDLGEGVVPMPGS